MTVLVRPVLAGLAEWTQTVGPGGGQVYSLAIDPSDPEIVYAGTGGGGGGGVIDPTFLLLVLCAGYFLTRRRHIEIYVDFLEGTFNLLYFRPSSHVKIANQLRSTVHERTG